jgi:hypothetical protein
MTKLSKCSLDSLLVGNIVPKLTLRKNGRRRRGIGESVVILAHHLLFQRMDEASASLVIGSDIAQHHTHDGKKGEIVAEGEARNCTGVTSHGAAKSAVNRLICLQLAHAKLRLIWFNIAEHKHSPFY